MSNRVKKDATEALSQLRRTMGDPIRTRLLSSISRYMGELRQAIATKNKAIESLELRNKKLQHLVNDYEAMESKRESSVSHLKSLLSQRETSLQIVTDERDRLSKENEKMINEVPMPLPATDGSLPPVYTDAVGLRNLIKSVRKTCVFSPPLYARSNRMTVIEIQDVMNEHSSSGYENMGRIVTLFAIMWKGGVTVQAKRSARPGMTMVKRADQKRFIQWIGRWMYSSPLVNKCWATSGRQSLDYVVSKESD